MASSIRGHVAKQLSDAIQRVSSSSPTNPSQLSWCVRCASAAKRKTNKGQQFIIPYKLLESCQALSPGLPWEEQLKWANRVSNEMKCMDNVKNVEVGNNNFVIDYDEHHFKKVILQDVVSSKEDYGKNSIVHQFRRVASGGLEEQKQGETVLVEYSSPNIAKPFHAGHLRSTIIGNFVANINEALSHKTIRINYLGDWGTQFGLLGVGYQKYGSHTKIAKDSMQHLFDIYVKINKEISDSNTNELRDEGKAFFRRMEEGDVSAKALWQYCRDSSITEYRKVYERLGVEFDRYEGESQYQMLAQDLVDSLVARDLVQHRGTPPVAYIDLSTPERPDFHANLQKSDGTTLYITRDVAAAIDRQERLRFDRAHYVVENGQHLHFQQLVSILKKMDYDWAHKSAPMWHVKFGRVEGMSTRMGEVVFLKDILDEAQARMLDNMKNTETTQVTENLEQVADRLGVSAIILQDLSERRMRNYKFSWQRALTFSGDSGVALQYTHARLCSLERKCGAQINADCDVTLLSEPIAASLVQHIAKFDECLQECFLDLQSHHLTTYLFQLRRLVNLANVELQVKGQPQDLAEARLLLFHAARLTLANGLRVLGTMPLNRM